MGLFVCWLYFIIMLLAEAPCLPAGLNFSGASSTINVGPAKFAINTAIPAWNGTLTQVGAIVGTQPITFNGGMLSIGNADAEGSFIYAPGATSPFVLTTNQLLRAEEGQLFTPIVVIRGGNRLDGSALFDRLVSAPLTLAHNLSFVTLGLAGRMGNIVMNGGNILLDGDLELAQDASLQGSGYVSLDGRNLLFGGPYATQSLALTHTLLLCDADKILIEGNLALSGQWTFTKNDSAYARIVGHDKTLDLTQGGSIYISRGVSLRLANIKIKGLGRGGFVFQDQTANIHLSHVEIEMANSYTVTIGGIYIEGESVIVTKNHLLTLTNAATLTVDGTTLWYDPTQYNDNRNIRPVVSAAAANIGTTSITYLNGGAIQGMAPLSLVVANSNAILSANRTFSSYSLYVNRTNSTAILSANRTHSSYALYVDRTLSNAILSANRTSSSYALYVNRTNSTAILSANRTSSSYALYVNRTLSNASLFGNRTNSNALLSANRTHSSYALYADRSLSNALLFGNRINSNALLFAARVNSNAMLRLSTNNSNAIISLKRTASSYALYVNRTLSNTILYNNRITSEALLSANRTSSSYALYVNRTLSNASLYGNRTNSNALLSANRTSSSYALYVDRTLSTALLFGSRINSNALLYLNRVNSNAMLRLSTNNSNAILSLKRTASSYALYVNRTLSNTILYNNRITSEALLSANRTSSSYALYVDRTLSSALLFGNRINSSALLFLNRVNSNAMLRLSTNNSNAIISLKRTASSYALYVNRITSEAILSANRTSSSYGLYVNRTLSNTILYNNRITSNTLAYDMRVLSSATLNGGSFGRTTSNALLFLTKNNSNALLFGDRVNSNAMLRLSTNNSNAIISLKRTASSYALYVNRTLSNTILYNNRITSEALLSANRTSSSYALYVNRTLSNTILFNNRIASAAIVFVAAAANPVLIRALSNTILYNARIFSNEFLSSAHTSTNNSFIGGSSNVITPFNYLPSGFSLHSNTTTVTFQSVYPVAGPIALHGGSLQLGSDLVLGNGGYFQTGGVINANNYSIDLAPTVSTFPGTSPLIFNTANMYLNNDLTINSTLKFTGACLLDAQGCTIILGPNANVVIGHNASLNVRNATIRGVGSNNISCMDNSASIIFDAITWIQDNNFTFSRGSFQINTFLDMYGTYTFAFHTSLSSTIAHNASLYLEPTFTFSYDPQGNRPKLLTFADNSSQLYMNNATIHATKYGMQLINGNLSVDGLAQIFVEGAVTTTGFFNGSNQTTGFILGDNNASHDQILVLKPGAILEMDRGYLIYQNVNAPSLVVGSQYSSMVINPGGDLLLDQTMNLGSAVLYLSTQAGLINPLLFNGSVSQF